MNIKIELKICIPQDKLLNVEKFAKMQGASEIKKHRNKFIKLFSLNIFFKLIKNPNKIGISQNPKCLNT